jgi:hypothetical protein
MPRVAERRPVNYYRAALTHYSVVLPALPAVALATLSWASAIVVFFVAELVVIGVLPRFGAFRRSVDAQLERSAAAALRLDVLARMSAAHRTDFDHIERLAGKIRVHCGVLEESGQHGPPDLTVERWLGLDRLVAIYAELAITHRRSTECFRPEDGAALEVERQLVSALVSASCGPSSAWLQRRYAILQLRYETWREAEAEREFLLQGLATIIDVVRCMHELCGVGPGTLARAGLDDVLGSWEANGATLREVSGLCRNGELAVDPRLLALGRRDVTLRRDHETSLGELAPEVVRSPDAQAGLSAVRALSRA